MKGCLHKGSGTGTGHNSPGQGDLTLSFFVFLACFYFFVQSGTDVSTVGMKLALVLLVMLL